MRVLTVNGSYRKDGVTDQVLRELSRELENAGVFVERVVLRDQPIEFCLNCRECTQTAGVGPGTCVHHDAMAQIVRKIEQADAVVLAAPTNCGSVTALFKRFMERLIVYAYWPWGAKAPKYRKQALARKKPALLISSAAAPRLLARPLHSSIRQLKWSAKVIGAKPVGSLFLGQVAGQPAPLLSKREWQRVKKLTQKLLH